MMRSWPNQGLSQASNSEELVNTKKRTRQPVPGWDPNLVL
jgi:hypothetical protein